MNYIELLEEAEYPERNHSGEDYLTLKQTTVTLCSLVLEQTHNPRACFRALNLRSLAYAELGEFDKSLQDITQAYDINKMDDKLNGYRCIILCLNDRLEEAKDAILTGLETLDMEPDHDRKLLLRSALISVHLRKKDYAQALTLIEETSQQCNPNRSQDIDLLRVKAYALREQKKYDEALKALETAISLKDDVKLSFAHLGDLFAAMGQREKAIDAYNQALADFGDISCFTPGYVDVTYIKAERGLKRLGITPQHNIEQQMIERRIVSSAFLDAITEKFPILF